MQKNRIKVVAMAVAAGLAMMSVPPANAAGGDGLQKKMDAVFGDMANVTRPGVFETQRRGVLAGGSAYVRSPIINTELVNLQSPSWKAGCGGIDFFGGSFSFINADQFVQLLRSVASNAKGYAFQVALDIACSDCMTWINNLQSKIQQLNEGFGNSCQLAQGLVNDVSSAMGYRRDNEYSLVQTTTGLAEDFFGSKSEASGKDKRQEVEEKKPEAAKAIVGNIVWDALQDSKANQWIAAVAAAGTAKEEYELMMSISGTIIIPKSEEDAKNPDTGNTNNPRYIPATISFKDLLDGGNIVVLSCDDDACLKPTEKTVQTVGMVKRIRDLLMGDGASPGVISKFGQPNGNKFTEKEANLMANMPASIGAIVRNLATASPDVAREQSYEIAYAVGMAWANELIEDELKAIRHALSASGKAEVKEMHAQILQRENQLRNAYQAYRAEHPSLADIQESYNTIQQNIYKIAVVAANGTTETAQGDK